MLTTPLKLVTIVGESVLGATGWTICEARGEGSRGMRASPVPGDNIRIEAVVSEAVADRILAALSTEYFPHFALVAWISDVQVVRGEKYRGDRP
jgi:nitrogen regulatory protein P-II 2